MTSSRSQLVEGDGQRFSRTVVALFSTCSEAEDAIRDLKAAGFTNNQIGVATQEQPRRRDDEELGKIVEETTTGMTEGASVGAITGGIIGGLVGLISSLLVPGLGPVLVGGVLASTLMGMGLGAATGGLIGALVGMGVPEEDARYFDAGFREGGTLVTVDAGNSTPEAVEILQGHGADLGPSRTDSAERRYQGEERRLGIDSNYAGPERRLVEV
jgi:hypothetical protein